MPRVLHVLPHRGGGAETYIDAVERALGADWEHERFALSTGREPAAALRSLPAGLPRLARAARRADVVHVHGDVAAVLAWPAIGRRPALMTTHGLHFLRRSEGARERVFGAALRGALRRCVRVLCTSHAERDALARRVAAESLRVVHNAVPPAAEQRDREQERAALGIGDEVVVLFAGQLEDRKRPLLAAGAAIRARDDGAPVVLLVAGDGPQAPQLGQLACDAVRPLGHSDRVDALYAAADVFVAPADREGLSYALLEAMGAGLAIVASDAPGNVEAVGDAGVVFPAGDEAALAAALAELAADQGRRTQLGDAARERARSEFGEEAFAAAIREAYAATQSGAREPGPGRAGGRA